MCSMLCSRSNCMVQEDDAVFSCPADVDIRNRWNKFETEKTGNQLGCWCKTI